jgi:hypothetical protein
MTTTWGTAGRTEVVLWSAGEAGRICRHIDSLRVLDDPTEPEVPMGRHPILYWVWDHLVHRAPPPPPPRPPQQLPTPRRGAGG